MIQFYYLKCTLGCFSYWVFFLYSNLIFLNSAQFHHIPTKLAKTPQICKSARKSSSITTRTHIRVLVSGFAHSSKKILFLDFFSQRKRADTGQFWPSPKKWLYSAKPMYGRYASCYSTVFGWTVAVLESQYIRNSWRNLKRYFRLSPKL